jgi:membrane protein DedA with SNARE-associated domain
MALSVPVAVLTALFRDSIAQLGSWGYLGAFTISLTSSATIFFPAPGGAAVILMGTAFNPYLLGAASGVGSALGSLTAYILGRQTNLSQGQGLLPTVALRSMRLFGGPIIFLGNLIPVLPMDLAGLAAGAARYPVLRYLVYATMANVLKMTALILAASTSLEWIRAWLQTWLDLY